MVHDEFVSWGTLSPANELLEHKVFRAFEISLGFRAAANAAVKNTEEPIKRRVLGCILKSKEFHDLCLSLLRISSVEVLSLRGVHPEEALPRLRDSLEKSEVVENLLLPDFYDRLSQDKRFVTIVMEAVAAERRWNDLWKADFRSIWERVRAVLEKIFDKHHPVSRALVSLLLSGGTLIFALQYKELRIPVSVDLDGSKKPISLKFDLGTQGQSVPIRFVAPDPVPVNFATSKPIQLSIDGKLYGKELFRSGIPDTSGILQRLDTLNLEIGGLPPAISGNTSARSDNLISAVRSVTTGLNGVASYMSNVVEATTANGQKLDALGSKLMDADLNSTSFQGVASSIQASSSIAIPVNESGQVFLQWLSAPGSPESCIVTTRVAATGSKTRYKISLSVEECSSAEKLKLGSKWSDSVELGANEPKSLGGQVPYHIVLINAEHPLFHNSRVVLRFQPDAQKGQGNSGSAETAQVRKN
jgi:hypothetical protein